MCLIQDVPTLGRHPVKRVHAAVPSAAEDDFPAFGTSQRVLAYDLPRTGCRSLWTRTMPLPCSGLRRRDRPHAQPWRAYPSAALGPTCRVAARKQERYVLMLMTKRLNGLSRFGKLSGLGISHIPAAPRPSDVAPGRRWNSTSAAHGHPWRAGKKAPEHLRATGLQTAPAWHRINARAGHPVTGRAWPCHACASRRILPRGLPGPARQRAPAAFPARQQPPGCR